MEAAGMLPAEKKARKKQTRVKNEGSSGVVSGAGWWWRRAGQPKDAEPKVDQSRAHHDLRRQLAMIEKLAFKFRYSFRKKCPGKSPCKVGQGWQCSPDHQGWASL